MPRTPPLKYFEAPSVFKDRFSGKLRLMKISANVAGGMGSSDKSGEQQARTAASTANNPHLPLPVKNLLVVIIKSFPTLPSVMPGSYLLLLNTTGAEL